MDEASEAAARGAATDVTLDLSPREANGARRSSVTPFPTLTSSSEPRVEILTGVQPKLSEETRNLLRARLQAATLLIFVGSTLFLVRNALLIPVYDPVMWAFHIVVEIGLGMGLLILVRRRDASMAALRTQELVTFIVLMAFFATLHYRMVLRHAEERDMPGVAIAIQHSLHFQFALMIVYGLLIPNNFRRAALVICALALTAPLAGATLYFVHPEVAKAVRPMATIERMSDNALMIVIGVMTAIYGSHLIHTLRVEAFEARRIGQYRLKSLLGAGGMGEVYLAEHQLLKRPCAVKLIRPSNAADPKALARFEREVRATAHLSHPNTVEIYDYGHTDDGTFYYVMEYLRGLSLADLVQRHGPLAPERVVFLLKQACGALSESHTAGLIHRDIKPANIFAAQRGGLFDIVKLLDFGLVKTTAETAGPELSREGAITGSPLYMSPEQALGERQADARSDIYSLGAVAYFLLTGRPPFESNNALQVMIAHARDPVAPPSKLRDEVPDDLERVVLRCLAKDPAARYQSVVELARDLAAVSDADSWTQERAQTWWREVHAAGYESPQSPFEASQERTG
jgi:eukaryotic-like serine/threonine-protein kinase